VRFFEEVLKARGHGRNFGELLEAPAAE